MITEKQFLEEILALLDAEPDKYNPSVNSQCLYYKPVTISSANVADNCIIGKWLLSKDIAFRDLLFDDNDHQNEITTPATLLFYDLSFEYPDLDDLRTIAGLVQCIADGNASTGNQPLIWRKVASLVRERFEPELREEHDDYTTAN